MRVLSHTRRQGGTQLRKNAYLHVKVHHMVHQRAQHCRTFTGLSTSESYVVIVAEPACRPPSSRLASHSGERFKPEFNRRRVQRRGAGPQRWVGPGKLSLASDSLPQALRLLRGANAPHSRLSLSSRSSAPSRRICARHPEPKSWAWGAFPEEFRIKSTDLALKYTTIVSSIY